MANYTFIGGDQKQYGPVTAEQLRQWILDGRLNAQSQVKAESDAEWRALSAFPEFAEVLATRPAAGAPHPLPSGTPPPLPPVPANSNRLVITSLILAGVVVSAIFLILISIFAAMLLPALAAAKQKAETINCINNEHMLATAVKVYSTDNTNHFPPAVSWCYSIKVNVGSEKAFKCTAANSASRCDYAFNSKLDGMDESKIAPDTVMIFEADGGWNANGGPELMVTKPRHARVFVVAFADGSVQQLRESQLNTLRWDP